MKNFILTIIIVLCVSTCIVNAQGWNVDLVGSLYDYWDNVEDIVVQGDLLYVASHATDLRILDISDVNNPVEVGSFDDIGYNICVDVSGDYAYLGYGSSFDFVGIRIIDISDPESPFNVCDFTDISQALEIKVIDNLAYVSANDTLHILDISQPSNPFIIGSCSIGYQPYNIAVQGDYAYIAAHMGSNDCCIWVVNISDPARPLSVGEYNTTEWIRDVCVSGQYLYVSESNAGLGIWYLYNPEIPFQIGSFDYCSISQVSVFDDRVYAASYGDGLQIIDVSDPYNPVLAGQSNTPEVAECIVLQDNIAYI